MQSDLAIAKISDSLEGITLDFVVSGSIGAVESVRLIRSLRRLGAQVHPWLTAGGGKFVTPLALAWAADHPTRESFKGEESHIALHDGLVVAPASANFLSRLALGLTDSPALALAASYLGTGKPIFVLPNMHDSMFQAPPIKRNIESLRAYLHVLEPREEEGKLKFAEPARLANIISHDMRQHKSTALITMGSTRAYIDEVRYISNYSSGMLGSLIADELYRCGISTDVVCGSCQFTPTASTTFVSALTNDEMRDAALASIQQGAQAAVLLASICDYGPEKIAAGKIRSDQERLSISLARNEKIIARINPPSGVKVGFKLETDDDPSSLAAIADRYLNQYGLSMLVVNLLRHVGPDRHEATIYEKAGGDVTQAYLRSKEAVAHRVAHHVIAAVK